MYHSAVEALFQQFVLTPGLDTASNKHAADWRVLQSLTFEQRDAVERQRLDCAFTAFREGLRLGLLLGTECGLSPRPPL